MTEPRYRVADLTSLGADLLVGVGVAEDRARTIAELLVEADLMGHTTHGLALLGPYLGEIESGEMTVAGDPEVVRDTGACITWDGNKLPGVWLTARAIDTALGRVKTYGTATVVIRRSHHIACLAAFLPLATSQGCMIILTCSDPAAASVAPYGGTKAVFTPDPIAVGIPTGGDPILIDMSASITTNGMSNRLLAEGKRFPQPWLIDAAGRPTNDPAVLVADPPGTILPTGGMDHGHKGYGLALTVEALTQGLGAFGRAEEPGGWGASVFVQLLDPEAFGGRSGFTRETDWVVAACHASPPRAGFDHVRLPGESAMIRRRRALSEGCVLHESVMPKLAAWAEKQGRTLPSPLS
ncbi:MAG: Ldh family oxidoreductase [Geminicoccaceae bacterium]